MIRCSECHCQAYCIHLLKKRENIFSEKVYSGFDIGNIIDLTASTIIKRQPV